MFRRSVMPVLALLFSISAAPAALADGMPAPGNPTGSGTPTSSTQAETRIGIRLLDAPVSRRADPRAHAYIIDFMPPGSTIERRVEIANLSSVPEHVDVYAAAASIQDNAFAFAPDQTPDELTTWTKLSQSGLDLPAYGRSDVTATVAVPRDASSGERYAVIWARVVGGLDATHNVALASRVGVRMYIDVGPGGEPPSDFQIERLTPVRTKDGPEVTAQVHNTGGRAVDLSGTLSLSEGPGGLQAGPYQAQTGTTLAPGGQAPVVVPLDPRLPNGPWRVDLMLRSGLIQREVVATLTFPAHYGMAGKSIRLYGFSPTAGLTAAGLAILALATTIYFFKVRRARRPR